LDLTVNDVVTPGTCANNYTITRTWTATDVCGNSSTSTQIITVDDNTPPVILNCPDSQMFCSTNSGIYNVPTISVSDNCIGEITTIFNISGATNRNGIGNDASGVFEIGTSTVVWTVTDVCNNESTCSVIVTIDETLLPTFSQLGPFCIASSPDTFPNVSLNGVIGSWSPDVINADLVGTVEYLFTPDADQCATLASMNVEIIEITLDVTTSNPICFGGNGSIGFASSGSNGTYSYTVNGSPATNPHSAVASTYTVAVSDGTCSASQNVTLVQPLLLDASYTKTNVTCNGDSNGAIDVTVEGGTTPYSFAWSDGNMATEDRTGLVAGTYSVVVSDANGCSFTISNIVITQPQAVSVTGVISNVSCNNGTNGGVVTTTIGGNTGNYTYLWSSLQQTASISNVGAGTYAVTATDAQACTGTASFVINQPEEISITSQISNPSCHALTNGEVLLTVSGGTPSYSYQWNPTGSGGSEAENLSGVGVGTYSVTVTDSLLCSSTATYTLIEPSILSVSETSINTTCDLPNGSISITANGGTPAYTYQWDANALNATTAEVSNLSNQSYTLTVTDANQCTIEKTIEVGRDIPPTLSLVEQINETCSDSNAEITVEVSDGRPDYTYSWSCNLGYNNPTIGNLSAGTHIAIVTDADGCTDSLIILITNHEEPQVQIVSISPAHCDQADGAARLEVTGGSASYSYDWGTTPARTSNYETQLMGNHYTVTVSDGVCDVEIIVDVPNLPGPTVNASANPSEAYVSRSLIRFNDGSTGATSWNWDFGNGQYSTDRKPSYNYEHAGTYDVILTVIDDYGCSASDTVQIVIHEGLVVWIPDAFTPNGDGLNDSFGPRAKGMSLDDYEMVILDRWGKLAFITNDYYQHWDGTIYGQRVEVNSIYLYKITIKDVLGKKHLYSGRVSLIY
ncbi:MAG: gliding motility-associated C-terminal domain-containing protein, partial [Bacteroidales bacterium]|nr:gliding motility-associated C-terminal domain-containing protein [Bacteroidales bacterium]